MIDLRIRGGKILDGTGAAELDAEIGIRGDRIAYVGKRADESAARTLDVDGLTIVPGFIDVHSHADGLLLSPKPDDSKVVQGITTEIVGNCGFSIAPINSDFRDLLITNASVIATSGAIGWAWSSFKEYLETLD